MRDIAVLVFALIATGCATTHHGRYQEVSVQTDPPGAEVRVTCGHAMGTHVSPVVVRLARGADACRITLSKSGFRFETVDFITSVDRRFWWNFLPLAIAMPISVSRGGDQTFVDFMVGAVASGVAVGMDAISDAIWTFHPKELSLRLVPEEDSPQQR